MKSSEQIAEEWGLSKITINDLCNKGKIPGAVKEGRKWLIPDDVARPADGRVSSGKYAKRNNAKIKPLPIGISDYVRAQAEYYYVDKTLLIKEFLDQKPLVSLFPKRLGLVNKETKGFVYFLRFLTRIRVNTLQTRQSGNVVKSIVSIRGNIQLSF